jgi:cell wall-associated NlpC family hydrolase
MPGPAGLTEAHRSEARRIILMGARLLLASPVQVHYTQDAFERWAGIREGLRVAKGERPTHGDCSSTHSWLVWNALTHVGAHADHLNGQKWRAGYTGTIASHGVLVRGGIRAAKVGDAVLYGPGPTFEHVATYIGGGLVFSHGSERGPFKLGAFYRPVSMVRRHF